MWRYVLLSMQQINMWLDLQKPITYAHNGKESFSSSIDTSINKLTNYHNTSAKSSLIYLRSISEACQMSTSVWVSIECHRSACTGSHLAGNHHPTHPWIKLSFVTFWVHWDLILGHFTLKIAGLCCNHPIMAIPTTPHTPPLHNCSWCW